jgi:perosamine synthetase
MDYVQDAISSTWISSTGKYVDRFEKEFAGKCNSTYALGVANGTIALHLALLTLDIGPGDEVLLPSLTFVATANAVRYVGAEPVFIDVDLENWCIDPTLLEDNITSRTKAIIAVHLYGHPADMDGINAVAEKHGLWVVEDAAEAHFATYRGNPVGALGHIGTFSFYGNKIITSGEGGAITFNDKTLYDKAKLLRGQGMDPERRYFFPVIGHNFRLTNVACALLCAQLERADAIIQRRREIFRSYEEVLSNVPGITFQPVADWACPASWLFSILVSTSQFGRSRDALAQFLDEAGVETRPFFIPLHTLPPYSRQSAERNDHLRITEKLGAQGLNLPTYSALEEEDIRRIGKMIAEAVK